MVLLLKYVFSYLDIVKILFEGFFDAEIFIPQKQGTKQSLSTPCLNRYSPPNKISAQHVSAHIGYQTRSQLSMSQHIQATKHMIESQLSMSRVSMSQGTRFCQVHRRRQHIDNGTRRPILDTMRWCVATGRAPRSAVPSLTVGIGLYLVHDHVV